MSEVNEAADTIESLRDRLDGAQQGEFVYRRVLVAEGVRAAESTGEEIVRCRDCEHCVDRYGTIPLCGYWVMNDYDGSDSSSRLRLYPTVRLDDFCSRAKRKEADDGR